MDAQTASHRESGLRVVATRPSLRIRLANLRGNCVPLHLLEEVEALERELAALRERVDDAGGVPLHGPARR